MATTPLQLLRSPFAFKSLALSLGLLSLTSVHAEDLEEVVILADQLFKDNCS